MHGPKRHHGLKKQGGSRIVFRDAFMNVNEEGLPQDANHWYQSKTERLCKKTSLKRLLRSGARFFGQMKLSLMRRKGRAHDLSMVCVWIPVEARRNRMSPEVQNFLEARLSTPIQSHS